MPTKSPDEFENFAKVVWTKKAEGLPVTDLEAALTSASPQDVQYMLQRYAFIQLLNAGNEGIFEDVKLFEAKSGWTIYDYGNALSSSPGENLFGEAKYALTESGLDRIQSGKGTIIKQCIDTAIELVAIAKERKWTGIHIVGGHDLINWGIWSAAKEVKEYNLEVTGYTPSKEEVEKYERTRSNFAAVMQPAPKPTV